MQYDKALIEHKLERWDKFITEYHLPEWDAIPDFGLYMDQVIALMEQYLSFIPSPAGSKEKFVTSSTVNNYVRLKVMPAPVNRKYYRIHLAYLIIILTMKQSLSISDVQKILPLNISDDQAHAAYDGYARMFRQLALFFNQQVKNGISGVQQVGREDTVDLLVIESALIAGFSKILAEKLIRLCGADTEQVLAAEKKGNGHISG